MRNDGTLMISWNWKGRDITAFVRFNERFIRGGGGYYQLDYELYDVDGLNEDAKFICIHQLEQSRNFKKELMEILNELF